ncbi:MAG: PASTA domain-containing protein [Balneolales bacterium]|nr:PASTA domain-containing protein [Balneolales bacterium]
MLKSIIAILTDKRLYIGLFLTISIGAGTLLLVDRVLMPMYTNYNQGITVPDVTKLSLEEAEKLLGTYGLRYEVMDRRSNEAFPPNYVLDQAPHGNSIVKPNRKIYLTVNASVTPTAVVPDIVNLSLRNAQIQLVSHGLEVGNIEYASSRFQNSVLAQSIPAGNTVRRGTIVNLVVSDGLGMNRVAIPDIIGKRLAIAQREIRQSGLRVGTIEFQPTTSADPNIILSFSPSDSDSLFEGERIDLIVSELARTQETIERAAEITDSTDIDTDTLEIPAQDPDPMP